MYARLETIQYFVQMSLCSLDHRLEALEAQLPRTPQSGSQTGRQTGAVTVPPLGSTGAAQAAQLAQRVVSKAVEKLQNVGMESANLVDAQRLLAQIG